MSPKTSTKSISPPFSKFSLSHTYFVFLFCLRLSSSLPSFIPHLFRLTFLLTCLGFAKNRMHEIRIVEPVRRQCGPVVGALTPQHLLQLLSMSAPYQMPRRFDETLLPVSNTFNEFHKRPSSKKFAKQEEFSPNICLFKQSLNPCWRRTTHEEVERSEIEELQTENAKNFERTDRFSSSLLRSALVWSTSCCSSPPFSSLSVSLSLKNDALQSL